MKMKPMLIIFSVVFVVVIALSVCFVFLNQNKSDTYDGIYDVKISNRNDLTKVLGFDFTHANIEKVFSDNQSNFICVILNEDYTKFSTDKFIKNNAFHMEHNDFEAIFRNHQKSFPDVFSMDFSVTSNNDMTGKTYRFYVGEYINEVPYYVEWFSTKTNGQNKCFIYAYLPDDVENIMVENFK